MAETLNLDDVFSDLLAEQSGKPTKSDDEVLRQGLNRSGGSRNRGGGIGRRQRRNEMTYEQMLEEGARRRREEGADSMIIDGVDYRDPQKPLGAVPTSSPVSNKKLKRIPLKDISSTRLLTEADIRELAMTKEFPVALQGSFRTGSSDPTLGGPMTTHQAEYEKLTDPFERERYLRERKEFLEGGQANEQFVEDLQDVQIPFTDIDALPVAAGFGTAIAGGLAAGAAIPAGGATIGLTGAESLGSALIGGLPFLAKRLKKQQKEEFKLRKVKNNFYKKTNFLKEN